MQPNPNQALFPLYKNLTTSLLFSVFLGPLGLLYASARGGIIMLVIGFVVISCRFPVPIIIMWLSCSIWSVLATNRYNTKLLQTRMGDHHEEKNHPSASSR